ncbi:MAG: tetratricopeptide repeat protein, partial [Flavobacteriales bacterium]|nr:tetratricopeptide repeat protein [Flavobacteriales bacterium]
MVKYSWKWAVQILEIEGIHGEIFVWRGFYSYFAPVLGMDSLIRVAVGFGVLSLFSVSACCQGSDEELNRLINSGYLYAGRDSAKALHIAREAALYAEKSNRPDGVIRAKILRAKTYGANQCAEDGIRIVEAVLANPIDNKATAVEANQVLGYLYRKNRNYREAVEQNRKTISLSAGDPKLLKWKGKAEFNLGYTHKLTAQFDTAMAAYVRALRAFEAIPEPAEMIVVYRQIGNLHLVSGNLDRALQVFEQNTKLARQYGDSSDMASNVMNIGVVYHKRHIYPTARSYYLKSLSYSESIPNFLGNAIAYGNIGSSLMDEGKPEEGIPYLLKAKKLKEDFDAAPNKLMHTLFDLSQAYRLAGNFEESKKMAREVIEMARENNDEFSRSIGYKNLALSEYEKGEYRKAYDHFTIHSNINDSLFNAQKSKQIKELEISYETEKKDRAIAGFEQERELEKSRRQNMYIGGLAFLVIGLVFYNQQRLRTKKNRELLVKEKEVDRLKSEFFANVSHEFRTPLTLILGPIQSKLAAVTDYKEREELLMMQRNAMRLQHLINDILDLSKFEAGKLELQTSSTHISELSKGLAGTFTSLADAKRIVFEIKVDAAIFGVVDKNKLETILINLLSNAFKYTPDGGTISLETHADESKLTFAVRDTGPGIPEEKLTKIFERFYQVDDREGR